MKKLMHLCLPMALFVISFGTASAQTVNQGTWMLGGSVIFSSDKYSDDDDSRTLLVLAPNAGYFIIDDLAVGADLSFTSASANGESDTNTRLAPFVRYYVVNPVFIQAQYGFGFEEGAGTFFSASAGYSWFVNSGVAIEPRIYYSSFNEEIDALDRSSFGLAVGFQAFLGR